MVWDKSITQNNLHIILLFDETIKITNKVATDLYKNSLCERVQYTFHIVVICGVFFEILTYYLNAIRTNVTTLRKMHCIKSTYKTHTWPNLLYLPPGFISSNHDLHLHRGHGRPQYLRAAGGMASQSDALHHRLHHPHHHSLITVTCLLCSLFPSHQMGQTGEWGIESATAQCYTQGCASSRASY